MEDNIVEHDSAMEGQQLLQATQPDYLDAFKLQVEKFDLQRLFEGNGTQLTELLRRAGELFGPLAARLEGQGGWIAKNWQKSMDYGYDVADVSDVRTAARCPKMLKSMTQTPSSVDPFLWMFSNREGHWNVGRGGNGLKHVLGIVGAWNPQHWATYQARLNEAILAIGRFATEESDCDSFWQTITAEKKWQKYPDLTVLFHLVWPQFFPVLYKSTDSGYSQLQGMDRLLLEISLKFNLKRKPINLHNYTDYAAAYRLLLAIYDDFVHTVDGQPRSQALSTPHFDFLTPLLAERTDVEAEELLLSKKSLVIYGIPGTGKTHFAQKELLAEPLFEKQNKVHRVQFHAGYSYADFMIGIRPRTDKGVISYQVEPGLLYRLAAEAANALNLSKDFANGRPDWQDGENEEDARTDTRQPLRYALLIDEINRADLARVFGELLYCIEYRGKNNTEKDNTMALPHRLTSEIRSVFTEKKIDDPFDGGQRFYLPENLYIVGTMNQADRSIGAFDAALRRRFAWYKLDFSVSRLQQILEEKGGELKLPEGFAKSLPEFIRRAHQLDQLIASGRSKIGGPKNALPLSAEHCIGHTWFAEIVGILESQGHRNGQISTLHLERLWLYFLQPQLEDALGFEALSFGDQLQELRDFFTKAL